MSGRSRVRRPRQSPGLVFKVRAVSRETGVRAEGIEPSLAASETAVLPLDEARKRFWSGPGGDRTLAFRVRTGCSSLELQTHRRSGRVGRSGIEPDSFRLKGGCITTVASVPLFLFEPALREPDLGFHRRPHSFVWRGGVEPLAARPPGYSRLELPLLRTRHVGGALSVDIVRARAW